MGALNEQQEGAQPSPPNPHGHSDALLRPRGLWGNLLGRTEDLFVMFGALAVAGMSAFVVTGVVMRNLLNMSLNDESVIVGELMIAALVLPLGKVAAEGGFITVDILTKRFQDRHAVVLNVIACVVGLVAAGVLFYAGYKSITEVLRSGSYYFGTLQLPEWPGKLMFFAGYVLFTLRLLDLLILDTWAKLKSKGGH